MNNNSFAKRRYISKVLFECDTDKEKRKELKNIISTWIDEAFEDKSPTYSEIVDSIGKPQDIAKELSGGDNSLIIKKNLKRRRIITVLIICITVLLVVLAIYIFDAYRQWDLLYNSYWVETIGYGTPPPDMDIVTSNQN